MVARVLSDDYGIGVRDGRFCAHPLVDRLAGPAGTAVRASIGLGTVDEHVDRLLAALTALSRAARREPGARPQPARITASRSARGITRLPRSAVPA